MKNTEIWMLPNGEVVAVTPNVCGCHPSEYLVEYSKRKAFTYCFANRASFRRWIFTKGMVRLL